MGVSPSPSPLNCHNGYICGPPRCNKPPPPQKFESQRPSSSPCHSPTPPPPISVAIREKPWNSKQKSFPLDLSDRRRPLPLSKRRLPALAARNLARKTPIPTSSARPIPLFRPLLRSRTCRSRVWKGRLGLDPKRLPPIRASRHGLGWSGACFDFFIWVFWSPFFW